MSFLLDTDVAIHIRDGDVTIVGRVAALGSFASFSLATLIELQAGLAADGPLRERRQKGLARMTQRFSVLPLDQSIAQRYGSIVEANGFSRTRIFDRLIAATAIVYDLTLITINGPDFRGIPGLKLEAWSSPAQ